MVPHIDGTKNCRFITHKFLCVEIGWEQFRDIPDLLYTYLLTLLVMFTPFDERERVHNDHYLTNPSIVHYLIFSDPFPLVIFNLSIPI
jgi:hypothetical protein